MDLKKLSEESITGLLLVFASIVALVWANSSWSETYHAFWETKLTLEVGNFTLAQSLHKWINDGLMALFFFSVGLEIKAELVGGELSSPKKAILPIAAAIGGMIIPALIFTLLNQGGSTAKGWGIPMATDIAFAIVLVSLFKRNVPTSLIVFLTALAVVDDLGAILIIAIFYSDSIDVTVLLVALVGFIILIVGNKLRVRNPFFYLTIGIIGLWYFFLRSGVHATIAGVLIALAVPARTKIDAQTFGNRAKKLLNDFMNACPSGTVLLTKERMDLMTQARKEIFKAETPLQRWDSVIQPINNFFVLPLFALSNAGVVLNAEAFEQLLAPLGTGIVLALCLGKPIGILSFTYLSVKLKIAELPARVNWYQLLSVAALAGIGFTVSLFITELAFDSEKAVQGAKLSVLIASTLAATGGTLLLSKAAKTIPEKQM
ncbi:MAG: Na+/H+ antiporter NhaA [Thermonemataceae bacterium]